MIRFRIVWLIFLSLFFAHAVAAQKTADLKRNGEKYYANARWQDALQALNQYQEQKPGDFGVLAKLGICYYHVHQPAQARKYLEYLVKQNPGNAEPDVYYYLARSLHGQQEYDKAIVLYKAFLHVCGERNPLRASIPDQIRRCLSGQTIGANDAVALVENLGDHINTAGDEFAPLPSVNHSDRLYFSAAKEGCTGGQRNDEGYEDLEAGHWCSDMFAGTLQTGGWESDAGLSSLLNTSRFEVALGFNENGKVLYYFRGFTLYSGEIFVDTAGSRDEYAVVPPAFKSPMRPEEGDAAPFFFNDTTLLFASRRAGGFGGLDLYSTVFSGGAWSEPQNLGSVVNSAYDETTPFLARDGRTLYFSSNHTGSMGGLDVFKTVFDDQKKAWQTPQNMGLGVNSPDDDAFFRLSPDGRTGFLSSDRLEGYGQRDLYIVYFKELQTEQDRVSKPTLFADVLKAAQTNDQKSQADERQSVELPLLMYDTDRDLLSEDNRKTIDKLAGLARQYPETTLRIIVHTDETGPAKFDLYNGIKRAEIVGKALLERGVPAGRMLLFSCGAAYPVAHNVVDAAPNPTGQKLNRRIEATLVTADGAMPLDISLKRPAVSELMAAPAAGVFEEAVRGLFFKVEVASTRQILNNDALSMFNDMMIESQPGSGLYRYSVGLFKQYQPAAQLAKDLIKQGFPDATVFAYLNGIRISKAEAVGLVKKYADLAAYIKG